MSNQWFRLYAEILNEPKVQILTEALRWRYVALLCLQCNGNYENRPDDEIALSLRVTVDEWISTRQEFIKRGLLSSDYKISGWDKRQYISDLKDPTAADRQKRYRDNKRNYRNAPVTSRLPEADTDTDTEIDIKKTKAKKVSQKNYSSEFESWWQVYPKNAASKSEAAKSYQKAIIEGVTHETLARSAQEYGNYLGRSETQPAHATTWLNQRRWETEYGTLPGNPKPAPQGSGSRQGNTADRIAAAKRKALSDLGIPGGVSETLEDPTYGIGEPVLQQPEYLRQNPRTIT